MLRSASSTRTGILATLVGFGTLIIGATAVFNELQSALNVIWKAPASGLGVWHLLKSRLLSLSVVLVIGFLLLVSLVISTALAVFSDYLDWILPGFATILHVIHLTLSFGFTAVVTSSLSPNRRCWLDGSSARRRISPYCRRSRWASIWIAIDGTL